MVSKIADRVKILKKMAPDVKSFIDIIEQGLIEEVILAPDDFIDDYLVLYKKLKKEEKNLEHL